MRRYRCSICGETVEGLELAEHLRDERDKPTWPGELVWTGTDELDDPDGFDAEPRQAVDRHDVS